MLKGRGRDRTVNEKDLRNMSGCEINAVLQNAVSVKGTVTVRGSDGNVRYDDPKKAGQFNEDKL